MKKDQLEREVNRLRLQLEEVREQLNNEQSYNEGWQEHIGDLLDAMKPFVVIVKESNGNIPTDKLSFAHWHSLTKAFNAASDALNVPSVGEQWTDGQHTYFIRGVTHDAVHVELFPTRGIKPVAMADWREWAKTAHREKREATPC